MTNFDFATLGALRAHHPTWRLLRADSAPLVASFLYRAFVAPNARVVAAADLVEALEDELYTLRQASDGNPFPKAALDYLNEWAAPDRGWLRKFYRSGTDEAQFDLTPATEKAIAWLVSLTERPFVGTESRLLTLFTLLEQIASGTETDPARRMAELRKKRDEIDAEIARVMADDMPLLDDTAIKDRFLQFQQLARELLNDFREVEHNFRQLDRKVRERIALWEGTKGALLDEIMGERDAIADSDQGKSFRAFWDFLMSSQRQEELNERLERVLQLPAVTALRPEARIRRVHYDWLVAGEQTQRTVAQLSQQLRRFLDDRTWLENRRIMDLLHGIEKKALALRDTPPSGAFMEMEAPGASIELPLERPLFRPVVKPVLTQLHVQAGDEDIDPAALFEQVTVDVARLARHIRHALQDKAQITLAELVRGQPLEQGLAELLAYLRLGNETFRTALDESITDVIDWQIAGAKGEPLRRARLPRIIFLR
jgi:flagellar motility protein MotE (MotC chaperone)